MAKYQRRRDRRSLRGLGRRRHARTPTERTNKFRSEHSNLQPTGLSSLPPLERAQICAGRVKTLDAEQQRIARKLLANGKASPQINTRERYCEKISGGKLDPLLDKLVALLTQKQWKVYSIILHLVKVNE